MGFHFRSHGDRDQSPVPTPTCQPQTHTDHTQSGQYVNNSLRRNNSCSLIIGEHNPIVGVKKDLHY